MDIKRKKILFFAYIVAAIIVIIHRLQSERVDSGMALHTSICKHSISKETILGLFLLLQKPSSYSGGLDKEVSFKLISSWL
uniref:Uncharacterized protein n=1 Tax=Octopus bimaculoides TaxID=37653 RepID=A0A0L8FNK2_OCTBM